MAFEPANLPAFNMDRRPPAPVRPMLEADYHQVERGMIHDDADDDMEGEEFDVSDLVRKADEAEESSYEARVKAERDRDYYDGKQLTQEEYDALVKRGQPPIAFNVIRDRVGFHQGMEKKLRRDPKAEPRTDQDAQGAEAFTDGLRYVIQRADYLTHRSAMWRSVTVEGFGGVELWVVEGKGGNYDIKMGDLPWDRLLIDPHSTKPDFSDSDYYGLVTWRDWGDAVRKYRASCEARGTDVRDILVEACRPRQMSDTYDDKPRQTIWADSRRRRVKVVTMWVRQDGGWWFYDFCQGGILDSGPSPYTDADTGETLCPWVLTSCYIDRENNRYGVVRDLIDPQDELNKRRSKSLHLLNSRGATFDQDAVESVEKTRRELAKPNAMIAKRPGAEFTLHENGDLASGQVMLMQSAMSYILESGPNRALLGDTPDQSGKAIGLQQAGGLVEQGDLYDRLRTFDLGVYRLAANMMKAFWTAEKWVLITDNPLAPKWVGFNVEQPAMEQVEDPETGEVYQQEKMDPYSGQPLMEVHNDITRLDVDIILTDDEPQVTLDDGNYETLTALFQAFGNMPTPLIRLAITLHPHLPTRRKKEALDVLEQMEAQQQQAQQAQQAAAAPLQQLEMAQRAANVDKTKVDTIKTVVDTQLQMQHGATAMMAKAQPRPFPGGAPRRPGERPMPHDKEQVLGQGPLQRSAVNIRN